MVNGIETREWNFTFNEKRRNTMKIDGSCHCGDITFEAEADPANTSICHCTDCQQLTGTAFRTSIRAQPGTFKILTGEPAIYVKTAESGNKRVQAFCRRCGSPIYATSPDGAEPKLYNIRLGTRAPARAASAEGADLVSVGGALASGGFGPQVQPLDTPRTR